VISEDLKPEQGLPSVRELARLYNIHFNTVSAAYHDLWQVHLDVLPIAV
jgi:DNA-binding transcriptional regulator YhcF (GntR family)